MPATVGKPLARLAFRPRVRGREHLAAGGFVLGANHLSGFDNLALAFALYPRAFCSMAKVQLFERPLLGPLVRALGAFPARGGDEPGGAVATAARLVGWGEPVVIFPAGARLRKDPERRPRTGAARAAIQAGVRDLISIDPPILNHRVLLSRGFLGSTAEVPGPVRREAAEAHLRVRRRIDELLHRQSTGALNSRAAFPPRPHFRNRLEASETAAAATASRLPS